MRNFKLYLDEASRKLKPPSKKEIEKELSLKKFDDASYKEFIRGWNNELEAHIPRTKAWDLGWHYKGYRALVADQGNERDLLQHKRNVHTMSLRFKKG